MSKDDSEGRCDPRAGTLITKQMQLRVLGGLIGGLARPTLEFSDDLCEEKRAAIEQAFQEWVR